MGWRMRRGEGTALYAVADSRPRRGPTREHGDVDVLGARLDERGELLGECGSNCTPAKRRSSPSTTSRRSARR
jgi:hypothetical protein